MSVQTIHIRPAGPGDASACADIHLGARAGMTYLPQDLHTAAETHDWMRDEVLACQTVFVMEADGSVVGYVSLDGEAMISGLYVLPGHQSAGIGSALLERVIEHARGIGLERQRLWVFRPNHRAIRFYERHGFATIQETDGSGNEEKVPDRLMEWRAAAS